MHDAAVVPHDHITVAPFVRPFECIAGGVTPNGVEQCLALIDLHPNNPRIETASQEQTLPPRLRMGAHQRVDYRRVAHLYLFGQNIAISGGKARTTNPYIRSLHIIDLCTFFCR